MFPSPAFATRLSQPARARFDDWPLALKTALGFWAFYMLTVLLRGMIGPDGLTMMRVRLFNGAIGAGLSLASYLVIRMVARDGGLKRMIAAGVLAILPASVLMSYLSITLATHTNLHKEPSHITTQEGMAIVQRGGDMRIVQGNGNELRMTLPVEQILRGKMPSLIADGTVTWFFMFAAWATLFIALTEQRRTLAAERRLADAETAAHAAQVRALRYQVNPHFLFNTLNSLSSLVMSGRNESAEDMLMALSTFFRQTLSVDPGANVTLAEEIHLQRLYLDIEKTRFPDRLDVVINVPAELQGAKVPALILQPIVENAIKYGVSATRHRVKLEIAARALDDRRMQIEITNSLADTQGRQSARTKPEAPHSGTGVGLANVCARLDAQYGNRADCRFGPLDLGGYRVSIAIPLEDHD